MTVERIKELVIAAGVLAIGAIAISAFWLRRPAEVSSPSFS